MAKPVIITCAATGGIHTPAEITEAAVGAAEARERLALKGAENVKF